jgi:hypothetical protein
MGFVYMKNQALINISRYISTRSNNLTSDITNERGGIRTPDRQDRNLLLYPLSHAPSNTLDDNTLLEFKQNLITGNLLGQLVHHYGGLQSGDVAL